MDNWLFYYNTDQWFLKLFCSQSKTQAVRLCIYTDWWRVAVPVMLPIRNERYDYNSPAHKQEQLSDCEKKVESAKQLQ